MRANAGAPERAFSEGGGEDSGIDLGIDCVFQIHDVLRAVGDVIDAHSPIQLRAAISRFWRFAAPADDGRQDGEPAPHSGGGACEEIERISLGRLDHRRNGAVKGDNSPTILRHFRKRACEEIGAPH